jgi:membrane protein YdbS with pleckstrin-like domain
MVEPEMEDLAPAVVSYWRVVGFARGLRFAAFAVPIGLPLALLDETLHPGWYAALGLTIVVATWLWSLLTAPLRYARTKFRVGPTQLLVRRGVVVHHELVVPLSRMQHVDIDRGPIERLFGIATLSVYTAGGRRATVRIPGLRPARAEELRAFVLKAQEHADDD